MRYDIGYEDFDGVVQHIICDSKSPEEAQRMLTKKDIELNRILTVKQVKD